MQHFDGARLSPNSFRNAVWHALNEPVCQYLRTRNPRCSTVYIDNSLGPLARDSLCITPCASTRSSRKLTDFYETGYWSFKPKDVRQEFGTGSTGQLTAQFKHCEVTAQTVRRLTEFVEPSLPPPEQNSWVRHCHLRLQFPAMAIFNGI